MNQYNKIAIIGGTGKAGHYFVKLFAEQGYHVRMLSRKLEDEQDTDKHIEIVHGDVRDFDSVLKLISGCDAVVSALGQTKGETPVFRVATQNIIRATDELAIKRYIVITGLTLDTPSDKKSFGTKLRSKLMRMSFPSICNDKQKEYKLLTESNLDWTIIRLPFIVQTDERYNIKRKLTDCRGDKISTTDLAYFVIDLLQTDKYIKEAPFVANIK